MAIIENGRRIYNLSARVPEEMHADLVEYAQKSRSSIAEAARVLMGQALQLARDEELELADR